MDNFTRKLKADCSFREANLLNHFLFFFSLTNTADIFVYPVCLVSDAKYGQVLLCEVHNIAMINN